VATAPKEEKRALVLQAQALAAQVKEAQQRSTDAEAEFSRIAGAIGNIIIDGVPAGGEDDWNLLREVGEKATFDFEPRDHADLGELLGAIDIARGVKVSGSRFYFLKGVGARLELALMNMALDKALAENFVPLITPTLVRPEIMAGTGFLGEHSDEIYYLPADDLYLTGTSEVALAGFHSDEILDLEGGSKRYAGWSTCYRREAGSGGKDTRGILRVHQFNKLEMFSYVLPEQAEAEHLALVSYQEQMMQDLGLSYRVIDTAAGDLGSSAARKYDIEAWIPTQDAYRELTSTSNCTTFQARRLETRYRTESGKTAPVATLNGTLATTRWIVAILETHQQADGSVIVPEVLRPYLNGVERIEPK
jgi:seryl-tRNA synthetase